MQDTQNIANRLMRPAAGCATAAVCLLALGTPSLALDLDDSDELIVDTVADRERRRLWEEARRFGAHGTGGGDQGYRRPDGLRVGNFLIFPDVGGTVVYDDNIFATAGDTEADVKFITTPRLDVLSQWPRHAFHARVTGQIVNYAEHSSQDHADVSAMMRTALEIDHAHTLSIAARSSLEHQERSELTSPRDAIENVPLFRNGLAVGLTRDAGRLYGTVAAEVETFDFSDVEAADGSTIDQDQRDQTIFKGKLITGYRFSPGYEAISELRIVRSLAELDNASGADRDSTGYEGLVGLAFEQGPLVNWRLLGGYGYRDYDSDTYQSVGSYILEAEAEWFVTQRLTLHAKAGRALIDEIGTDDSGRIEAKFGASAEIEIWHSLVATLHAQYAHQDFTGSERQDDEVTLGADLEWFAARNWILSAGYRHKMNDSTDAGYDITSNQVRIGARYRY